MQINGKYLKVWKKTVADNYIKLDLGEGEKQQDGTYKNWTWFGCFLAGKCKEVSVNEGDLIEIKQGKMIMQSWGGKWSPSVVIFEFEVMQGGTPVAVNPPDDTDIPF